MKYTAKSSVDSVRRGMIAKMRMPAPSLKEQTVIAEALSDVESLIDSLHKLIAKKKAIKLGAMQELLTGKKRLPGFSEEWDLKRIGDVLTIGHGHSQHAVETPYGQYPILATGGKIGQASKPLYTKESVLIGRKGTINRPQYVNTSFWAIDTLFYTILHDTTHAKFIYYQFCMIDWMLYNEASGVPSLSAKTIENINIKIPEYKEQTAIAQIISDMDAEIDQLTKKLSKYQHIKQGMMQNLLTGRIRLVDTDTSAQPQKSVQSKKHSQQFDDAVMIAGIVDAFYSEKYFLGRKKVQKLLYLCRRQEQADTSAFLKKAAGPYADSIRYKGGEPVAKNSGYIAIQQNDKGSCFYRRPNLSQALE